MSNRKDNVGVADLVQCLVLLFPAQHPKCVAWASTRSVGHPGATSKPHSPVIPPSAVAKGPEQEKPRPAERRAAKPPRRERKPAPFTRSPMPARPPVSVPGFARELTVPLEAWKDRHQGTPLSFAQEVVQRDKFAAAAGLTNPSPGYSATMLTVIGSVSIGPEKAVSVEVVIPRVQQPQSVLVGAGPKGMPKKYFETAAVELSPERVRQIGAYVLASGERG